MWCPDHEPCAAASGRGHTVDMSAGRRHTRSWVDCDQGGWDCQYLKGRSLVIIYIIKVLFTVTPVYKISALPQHLQTYFQNKDCACPPLVRTCKYCMHAWSQLYTEMYMYIYLNMCRLSQIMHIYLLCVIKFFDKLTCCSCMMLEGRCSE